MLDKNYLGHNLIPLQKFYQTGDYTCTICKVELYYGFFNDKYYFIVGENDPSFPAKICELNCNEVIIKSLIE